MRAGLSVVLASVLGCAALSAPIQGEIRTGFDPATDAFSFMNDLYWDYDTGLAMRVRDGSSEDADDDIFAQRCIVMTRTVRQFFYGARFDPTQPRVPDAAYRDLIRRVLATDARREEPVESPVVIPGFPDLRSFSAVYEDLLKAANPRWASYGQRGNWRMIFPFLRTHQQKTARSLLRSLEKGHPPIVHLVRFPRVTVNHSLLVHRARASATEIEFVSYDPNDPDRERILRFDLEKSTFYLPTTSYWAGGGVNVYEIYHGPFF